MPVIVGLLSFLVLLCCAVILRERKLRRGWQRVLDRTLRERGRHEGIVRDRGVGAARGDAERDTIETVREPN